MFLLQVTAIQRLVTLNHSHIFEIFIFLDFRYIFQHNSCHRISLKFGRIFFFFFFFCIVQEIMRSELRLYYSSAGGILTCGK